MLGFIPLTLIPTIFGLPPAALNALPVNSGDVLYMLVIINFSTFRFFSYSLAWYLWSFFIYCIFFYALVTKILLRLPNDYLIPLHLRTLNCLPSRLIFTCSCRITFTYDTRSVAHAFPLSTQGAVTKLDVQRLSLLPILVQLAWAFFAQTTRVHHHSLWNLPHLQYVLFNLAATFVCSFFLILLSGAQPLWPPPLLPHIFVYLLCLVYTLAICLLAWVLIHYCFRVLYPSSPKPPANRVCDICTSRVK